MNASFSSLIHPQTPATRHQPTDTRHQPSSTSRYCAECARPLTRGRRGPPGKFCSDACRNSFWYKQQKAHRQAI